LARHRHGHAAFLKDVQPRVVASVNVSGDFARSQFTQALPGNAYTDVMTQWQDQWGRIWQEHLLYDPVTHVVVAKRGKMITAPQTQIERRAARPH
jgi:hypothetical protein